MASNKCKHDIRVTEFIEGKQAGIDLTQRTSYFMEDMSQFTKYNPNSLNDTSYSNKGKDSVDESMVYFLFISLLGCIPILVYVGQTINGYKRINDHKEKGRPFDYWRYISAPHRMLDDIEEYYIRTYKPVLNHIKNPLYMWDNGKYRISKANFHHYCIELEQHIRQVKGIVPCTKEALLEELKKLGLIIPNSNPISFNLIPKELERKYFDL